MQTAPWLLYGAYGYTGSLIARAGAERRIPLLLAGRREGPLAGLARELALPWKVLALEDAKAWQEALPGCAGVLNCAGPFARTAEPIVSACLASRRHYLDITGEIEVFESVHERDGEARNAGVVLCPGVGFDVVPTDCVAAVLKESLPAAQFLALGFDARGGPSPGTARTMVDGLSRGGKVRVGKWLTDVPLGSRTRHIDFGNGQKLAAAVPWGDVATALYSTGIGNIECYVPVTPGGLRKMRLLGAIGPLFSVPPVRRIAGAMAAVLSRGPGRSELADGRVRVWGEARTGDGLCITARLETPNGYALTRDAALAAMARFDALDPAGGYYTPSRLFGARFVESLPGVGRIALD